MKAKETTHTYCEWRLRLDLHQQRMLARLEQRQRRDGDTAVLSDDQRLVLLLARILDEGGETTEYIRDVYDAE